MNTPKTTVIYHSADFDGIFCCEIARKFLPGATLIGWNHGDPLIPFPSEGMLYVLDLSPDCVERVTVENINKGRLVWIDHHKSSIEKYSKFNPPLPGYRIDGVAACRLAWQWFAKGKNGYSWTSLIDWPEKQHFIRRDVEEPFAVCLAGEYDIWCKTDERAELFQHGLRSEELIWELLLQDDPDDGLNPYVQKLLENGRCLQYARTKENASVIGEIGFTLKWEGLTFLACNAARYNSLLFTAGLTTEHDACFGFKWTGKDWSVSLYHAPSKEHHDLSVIAVKYGGGGHRGACGFMTDKLPFL